MSKKIVFDDGERMTEEEFEKRQNQSYQLGISEGLNRAADRLLEKATDYFQVRQDKEALHLRDLSKEFAKLADEAHPNKDK